MELNGKIKVIGDTQTFGDKGFKKRDLVITTDEQYPQHILIEFLQDKTVLLDKYKLGQEVSVSINIRGRVWTNPEGIDRYFNSINGWRIKEYGTVQKEHKQADVDSEQSDDLPFN